MENPIEELERLSFCFDKMDKNNYYMKQQLTDFSKTKPIKINFNFCHISLSKNGGLIAICKKKGYFDASKNSKLNKNILVFFQDSKTKYEIPIDWDYSQRWIICLDFTLLQDLYGILNDGGIFKFKYKEKTKKEIPTTQKLGKEGVIKAKFYENGFIAYTKFENFYYIKNIKDPTPIFMFNTGIIKIPLNFDFLMISPDNSSSGKLEILLTNEKGNGVFHMEQKLTGENIKIRVIDENTSELEGLNIILKGSPEPYLIKNYPDKENIIKRKENEDNENFGKIACIAQSPSGKKIAFYNNEKKEAYIMSSDLMGKYTKVSFKYNSKERTEKENNELKAILQFKEGYQFLFCGEDTLALSGQRFIILAKPKVENALIYLIQEGKEALAAQGFLFSKCISEVDGLRFLTNDGIYFISRVPKEFFEICYTFSNSDLKKFIKIYNKHRFSLRYDTQLEIKKFDNLPYIIEQLQMACSYIFWTEEENESNKKELQLFLIKASQFGKNFLTKGREEFNYDKYNERCKEIRMVNQLRNDENYPLFITYKEYNELTSKDIINIMLKYKNFRVAAEISEFLGYKTDRVKYKYMIEKMKNINKRIEKYHFDENKENKIEEEQIYKDFLEELEKIADVSYVKLAKKAIKLRNEKLSMKLLEQEKSALTKIPQLLELKKISHSLDICLKTYDFNILSIVLQKLSNKKSVDEILLECLKKPKFQVHFPKIVLFYKKYKPNELSKFLTEAKNYNQLFYNKLEELFDSTNLNDKTKSISECRKCNKNGNLKYKKYLDILNQIIIFKDECKKNNLIKNFEINKDDDTIYDYYLKAIKNDNYAFVEKQNKNLDYSQKKLYILRFRCLLENNKSKEIDEILEKTPIKKLGLTPLNMAEIYYDYKIYDKATEYLLQVKEINYLFYVVDLLKSMKDYKNALEIIISNKDFQMKEEQINDILKKEPCLKEYVDELCSKYKIII